MLDLALAVGCSLAIGMIFKVAGRRGMDRLALLTANYALAFGLGAFLFRLEEAPPWRGFPAAEGGLLALGIVTGALFILGFFVLALATEVAGMSLAIGVMRVSVVIPFLASWVVWEEVPSPAQGAGLVLACVAFFLIARRGEPALRQAAAAAGAEPHPGRGRRVLAVLTLLFVVGGVVDVLMKTFDETYAAHGSRALFLLLIFGVAFGIGLVLVLWKGLRRGRWPRPATLGWGLLLGAFNYGSVEFILRAIRQLSGPFVFPANNIALVIGAALLGVFFWGEHLSRGNWLGLALAALALGLLSAGR